jgi:hypothetical protein
MKKILLILALALCFMQNDSFGQRSNKSDRYFGNPVFTDSLSTIFFPTQYDEQMLSANKIALFGEYYANLIVYNYKTDSYRKLFENDTYIESFTQVNHYDPGAQRNARPKNITNKWIFLLVKIKDYNGSNRIDENDPSVLFVTNKQGEGLKALTEESENVVSFDIFEAQGFCLIKIQRDSNKDKTFKHEDKDFYYRKIDLNDLSVGKGIEIR